MPAVSGTPSGLVEIVREFLAVDRAVRRLISRFRSGNLRFDEVAALFTDEEESALFRLKEHCHALFRPRQGPAAQPLHREVLFDLAVGSLFHEAMQFRESFYQREVYGPRVRALQHEVGAEADCVSPIVVDDKHETVRRGEFERARDLGSRRFRRHILDAKLDEFGALARDARDPGGVGKNRVKRIEQMRAQDTRSILKNGVPATGVEGEAMSRGGVSPASKPRRPASTARAKAFAILTGSPALATAVLSSTAS